jgi:hypothetical protein
MFLVFLVPFFVSSQLDEAKAARQFETKIRPVLVSKCLSCHSSVSGKMKGNLDLATAEGLKRGGDRGKQGKVIESTWFAKSKSCRTTAHRCLKIF